MTPEERFRSHVDTNGPIHPRLGTRCHLWLLCKNEKGYGRVRMGGKIIKAHRAAWIFAHGEIPGDTDADNVLHHCDNPQCVNDEHLFLGTLQDNSTDMVEKGRAASGERSGNRLHPESRPRGSAHKRSKLTKEAVLKIRDLHASGVKNIHALFGVSRGTVSMVVNRLIWTHI